MIRTATAALPAALLTVVLGAGPALAAGTPRNPLAPQEGANVEAPIGVGAAILLYGLLPLVVLLGTAALVWLPGVVRGAGKRYRPGKDWDASPVWFAGPADPVSAVASAPAPSGARGGAGGDW